MKYFYLLLLFLFLPFPGLSQDHRAEIHCKHWLGGYPYGTPPTNDLIIRDIYALSNNDDTKFADWVAYRLDPEIISGSNKNRNWKADPWLDPTETLEPDPDHGDYKGAYDSIHTDRGHQAPLGSLDGSPFWYEANYLSNITPQKSDLNQGAWVALEEKVREMVNKYKVVYIMTGPLYEREMPPLPFADEPHKVPSGYWKIILVELRNGHIEPLAFIFDQETPRNSSLQNHLCTIDEVELRSNLDFPWELSDYKEKAIEANKNEDWFEINIK
ncbi:DNA/RNA non-specific endonuclease [Fulvivirga maritima]|uniref:DNA/RNA non-specific endonuclease n=1 Tax=Fulvivirga maritima TaxID=2904247 RepID=UPI001F45720B|nr:DNA/RNA non-specific endonuclease [Fulvivirga maritima]UII26747.1 DNA/RNA non-specific endonuclease [Fulvivirga maritima]